MHISTYAYHRALSGFWIVCIFKCNILPTCYYLMNEWVQQILTMNKASPVTFSGVTENHVLIHLSVVNRVVQMM